VTFLGDVMVVFEADYNEIELQNIVMTSFRYNQLQKPLFGQITELQVTNIED